MFICKIGWMCDVARIVIDVDGTVGHWAEKEFMGVEVVEAVAPNHIVNIPKAMMIETDIIDGIEENEIATITADALHRSRATTVTEGKTLFILILFQFRLFLMNGSLYWAHDPLQISVSKLIIAIKHLAIKSSFWDWQNIWLKLMWVTITRTFDLFYENFFHWDCIITNYRSTLTSICAAFNPNQFVWSENVKQVVIKSNFVLKPSLVFWKAEWDKFRFWKIKKIGFDGRLLLLCLLKIVWISKLGLVNWHSRIIIVNKRRSQWV